MAARSATLVREEFVVQVSKEAGAPLGISLENVGWFWNGRVAVDEVGSTSAAVGKINEGDEVLSINNVRCTGQLTQQYLDQVRRVARGVA